MELMRIFVRVLGLRSGKWSRDVQKCDREVNMNKITERASNWVDRISGRHSRKSQHFALPHYL